MRVLVTGGCGFVGSNLVGTLVRMGCTVTVLDDLFTGSTRLIEGLDVELHEGDVRDADLVAELVSGCGVVYHLAARNIIVSTRNPREDYEVNIGGTLNVLMAARESGTRVVYASSASVYGNPRHMPICEDDPPDLLTPYAVSKFTGEAYCLAFHESYNIDVSIVRYSNVYGVNQSPSNPYAGVMAKFMADALAGRPLRIHGNGQQTRDFTYVADAVEATIAAGTSPRAVGGVFNVAGGIETRIVDLAQSVIRATDSASQVEYVDRRDIDNVRRRVLNCERARRILRWLPAVDLDKGIAMTLEWMRPV